MEWILVMVAVGLVVVLVCDVADEVAYWWTLRRTDPGRHPGGAHDGTASLRLRDR